MRKFPICRKNIIISTTFVLSIIIILFNLTILLRLNYYENQISYFSDPVYTYDENNPPEINEVAINSAIKANKAIAYYTGCQNEFYNSSNPYIALISKSIAANLTIIALMSIYLIIVIQANKNFFTKKANTIK